MVSLHAPSPEKIYKSQDYSKKINQRRRKQGVIKIFALIIFILFFVEVLLRLIGYIYIGNILESNAKAFRESENILALGESSTAGLWVPFNDSYPAQLEGLLREKYPDKNIKVVVPIFIGQNTDQMSNRIDTLLSTYHPRTLIIMAGTNNHWALAESNIGLFIGGMDGLKYRILAFLDGFRTYRLFRFILQSSTSILDKTFIMGGPEHIKVTGADFDFAGPYQKEFVDLWYYDMRKIIRVAKARNTSIIIMTYHINPLNLPPEEFEKLAQEENITLVRNDLSFNTFTDSGNLSYYVLARDNWHPNALGYSIIAHNAFHAITENGII